MATDLQKILKLSVPVIVLIAEHRFSFDDVLALGPGAILELDRSAEDEQDVLINNKQIARGLAVKVGENFGVRITQISSQQERIEALGG